MCFVSLAVKESFMTTSFSVCVDYMQYILSYCSCFCPLSSLCSISSVGAGLRGRGVESVMIDNPPLSLLRLFLFNSAVLVKPVEVCGFFVFGGLCKKTEKKHL